MNKTGVMSCTNKNYRKVKYSGHSRNMNAIRMESSLKLYITKLDRVQPIWYLIRLSFPSVCPYYYENLNKMFSQYVNDKVSNFIDVLSMYRVLEHSLI